MLDLKTYNDFLCILDHKFLSWYTRLEKSDQGEYFLFYDQKIFVEVDHDYFTNGKFLLTTHGPDGSRETTILEYDVNLNIYVDQEVIATEENHDKQQALFMCNLISTLYKKVRLGKLREIQDPQDLGRYHLTINANPTINGILEVLFGTSLIKYRTDQYGRYILYRDIKVYFDINTCKLNERIYVDFYKFKKKFFTMKKQKKLCGFVLSFDFDKKQYTSGCHYKKNVRELIYSL